MHGPQCPVCTDRQIEWQTIHDRFDAIEWWCAACNSAWLSSMDGQHVYEILP